MLTLALATIDDLPDLIAWESDPDTSLWLAETGEAWHLRAMVDHDQESVLAHDAGTRVGFAVLAGLEVRDSLELRRMVVAPAHRGKGWGRELLHTVVGWAYGHHSARTVWLDVKSHNHRARSLYESAGFVWRETRVNAITEPDGSTSDLLIMVHQGGWAVARASVVSCGC